MFYLLIPLLYAAASRRRACRSGWLGLRQKRWLPQVSGALLQIGAAFAFVAGGDHWHEDLRFLINPTAIGALLLALAGFASAWSYQRRPRHEVALVYYPWGLLWWLGGWPMRSPASSRTALKWTRCWCWPRSLPGWRPNAASTTGALGVTALAMLALGFPLALMQSDAHHQPFAGYGALAGRRSRSWACAPCCACAGRRYRGPHRAVPVVAAVASLLSLLACGAAAKPIWHRAGRPCW